MKQPSEISDVVSEASSGKGSKPRVLESIVSFVSPIAQLAKEVLSSAHKYWEMYAPADLQLEAQFFLNTATSPARAVLKYGKEYVNNYTSSRYLMYQIIGGSASVGAKWMFTSLDSFKDGGYWNQLELAIAGTIAHIALQLPAYLWLEKQRYNQPFKNSGTEYAAWRFIEFLVGIPAFFMAAGQATLVEGVFGVRAGALSTSLFPLSPNKLFNYFTDTSIMHAIYRRLQIRKEKGEQTSGKYVGIILKNAVTIPATTIANGLYNYAIEPVNKYVIQPLKSLVK